MNTAPLQIHPFFTLATRHTNHSLTPTRTNEIPPWSKNFAQMHAEMTLNPRAFFARPDSMHRLPGPNTNVTLIRLLQEIILTSEPMLHLAFHDHTTLRDVHGMITTCRYIQESLLLGTLERCHFMQGTFDNWIEATKQHTKFELVCKLIRPASAGLIETPINRLRERASMSLSMDTDTHKQQQ